MNTYAIENDDIICHMYEEKNKIEKSVEQVFLTKLMRVLLTGASYCCRFPLTQLLT